MNVLFSVLDILNLKLFGPMGILFHFESDVDHPERPVVLKVLPTIPKEIKRFKLIGHQGNLNSIPSLRPAPDKWGCIRLRRALAYGL